MAAKKGTTVSRGDIPSSGVTVKEAIDALRLPKKMADAVSKAAAKAVARVGDSDGLADRIELVATAGGKDKSRKQAAIKAVNVWKKARTTGIFEGAANAFGASTEAIAGAVRWTVEEVVAAANTPAGQQALNGAMLAAGLPPVFSGAAATPEQAQAELALAGSAIAEPSTASPIPTAVLPALAGAGAGFLVGGPMGAILGAGLGYLVGGKNADS